jgi:hypothetical protein
MEIMTRGNQMVTRTYQPMPIYFACALIFILMNYGGLSLFHALEKQVHVPGFGSSDQSCQSQNLSLIVEDIHKSFGETENYVGLISGYKRRNHGFYGPSGTGKKPFVTMC